MCCGLWWICCFACVWVSPGCVLDLFLLSFPISSFWVLVAGWSLFVPAEACGGGCPVLASIMWCISEKPMELGAGIIALFEGWCGSGTSDGVCGLCVPSSNSVNLFVVRSAKYSIPDLVSTWRRISAAIAMRALPSVGPPNPLLISVIMSKLPLLASGF